MRLRRLSDDVVARWLWLDAYKDSRANLPLIRVGWKHAKSGVELLSVVRPYVGKREN